MKLLCWLGFHKYGWRHSYMWQGASEKNYSIRRCIRCDKHWRQAISECGTPIGKETEVKV